MRSFYLFKSFSAISLGFFCLILVQTYFGCRIINSLSRSLKSKHSVQWTKNDGKLTAIAGYYTVSGVHRNIYNVIRNLLINMLCFLFYNDASMDVIMYDALRVTEAP